jgi:hypothetical protein
MQPREQRVFFGAYDPDAAPTGVAEGLMARFMQIAPVVGEALPAGDFRDWAAIEAWADGMVNELKVSQPRQARRLKLDPILRALRGLTRPLFYAAPGPFPGRRSNLCFREQQEPTGGRRQTD